MTKHARLSSLLLLLLAGCPAPVATETDSGTGPRDSATGDVGTTGDTGSPADTGTTDDAGTSAFVLPTVHAICAAPTAPTTHMLTTTNSVPVLALALGRSDVGLAYVERPPSGMLELRFQRLGLDGALTGSSVRLVVLDMMFPGVVSIAADGADYVACASARCFRVSPADASTDEATVAGASSVAVAFGGGGLAAAWVAADGMHAGLLGSAGARLGAGMGAPSIAATATGYVVGYTSGTTATAVTLDVAGHMVGSFPLGTVRSNATVAVAFTAGTIGASFIGMSGDAMAATVAASGTVSSPVTIGPGASSYGQVSIARGANGFLASWSDFGGFIGVAPVALDGTATGTAYHLGSSWDDNAHSMLGLAGGFMLAANTTPGANPVIIASLACP